MKYFQDPQERQREDTCPPEVDRLGQRWTDRLQRFELLGSHVDASLDVRGAREKHPHARLIADKLHREGARRGRFRHKSIQEVAIAKSHECDTSRQRRDALFQRFLILVEDLVADVGLQRRDVIVSFAALGQRLHHGKPDAGGTLHRADKDRHVECVLVAGKVECLLEGRAISHLCSQAEGRLLRTAKFDFVG